MVPNLRPGSYQIKISHPEFKIEKAETLITVKDSVLHLPENALVIEGYPASGTVQSNKEPMADVFFVLYSKDVKAAVSLQ